MRRVVTPDDRERAGRADLGFQRGHLGRDELLRRLGLGARERDVHLCTHLDLGLLDHDAVRVAEPQHERVGKSQTGVDVRRGEQFGDIVGQFRPVDFDEKACGGGHVDQPTAVKRASSFGSKPACRRKSASDRRCRCRRPAAAKVADRRTPGRRQGPGSRRSPWCARCRPRKEPDVGFCLGSGVTSISSKFTVQTARIGIPLGANRVYLACTWLMYAAKLLTLPHLNTTRNGIGVSFLFDLFTGHAAAEQLLHRLDDIDAVGLHGVASKNSSSVSLHGSAPENSGGPAVLSLFGLRSHLADLVIDTSFGLNWNSSVVLLRRRVQACPPCRVWVRTFRGRQAGPSATCLARVLPAVSRALVRLQGDRLVSH